MNLYEIDAVLAAWEPEIDPATGELLNIAELDALNMARNDKLENIALFIKDLDADAAKFKAEEKALAERRKACENKAERLRGYLSNALAGQKFETVKCAISFRKTSSVECDAEFVRWAQNTNNAELLRYREPEINKTAIKARLNEGILIPHARLVEGKSMTIK